MSDRLLIDLDADGSVSVTRSFQGELPSDRPGPSRPLSWPLDPDAPEQLRWYLEDYLLAPFGVYGDRGPAIAEALPGWGEALFAALFDASSKDAYSQLRSRGGSAELVFRSASSAMLALPWELLRDPDRAGPLVLDGIGLTRTLPSAAPARQLAAPGRRLRVLMVISRPAAGADVGYRLIARPLLERLEAVRGTVELVVLRPPTLAALRRALDEARERDEPFQIVHLDCHGMLRGRPSAFADRPLGDDDPNEEGVVIFERQKGGRDAVPVSALAQTLRAGRVPLVVLNACESGAVGKDLEAAIATRLLREGTAAVVAMAYAVYAVAAAEFIAAFYDRLFAGDTVAEAVTAGRRRLWERNLRPSAKGDLPLADWFVPVHYASRDIRFPALVAREEAPSLEDALDALPDRADASGDELAGVGQFVGRDALFYELELATQRRRVVVLHGLGGVGKTELAKAFGRWWRDTGGVERPQWVFFHSFEPGMASFGVDGLVASIGLRVFGADFARLSRSECRVLVERALAEHSMLLVLDNFETVGTMPDPTGVTLPLDSAERAELRDFLRRLADGGRSAALITSRTDESWLGDVERIEVGGMTPGESVDYAEQLLDPLPGAASQRAAPAFAELLAWLGGHPLSMRLVLPHLARTDARALLASLHDAGASTFDDGDRTGSLFASIAYSYGHLTTEVRRLLVIAALGGGTVDADVLAAASHEPGMPERFAGRDREAWIAALDAAASVGLLTQLGSGVYAAHPALPGFLAVEWRSEAPAQHSSQRAAAVQALVAAYATFGAWLAAQLDGEKAGLALALVDLEQRTMGHMLTSALDGQRWEQAQAILQPLVAYLDVRGRFQEAQAWIERARGAVEASGAAPPDLATSAGALWLYAVGWQAARDLASGRLDDAAHAYRLVLAAIEAAPPSDGQRDRLAVTYHQLGAVAQTRGGLAEAEDWYRRALEIAERRDDRLAMASTYHQLGIVAQERGRLDEAEEWYRRTLEIAEASGGPLRMASSFHQLGTLAEARSALNEAEDWYRHALRIHEQVGDLSRQAATYHQLGIVEQRRGRLDDAERWYVRSLELKQRIGDRAGLPSTYHQLGAVARLRGALNDAEQWYAKALELFEALGDRRGVAVTSHELGSLERERGRLDGGERWYLRALQAAEDLVDYAAMARNYEQLAEIARERGRPDDAEAWRAKAAVAAAEASPATLR